MLVTIRVQFQLVYVNSFQRYILKSCLSWASFVCDEFCPVLSGAQQLIVLISFKVHLHLWTSISSPVSLKCWYHLSAVLTTYEVPVSDTFLAWYFLLASFVYNEFCNVSSKCSVINCSYLIFTLICIYALVFSMVCSRASQASSVL